MKQVCMHRAEEPSNQNKKSGLAAGAHGWVHALHGIPGHHSVRREDQRFSRDLPVLFHTAANID